jgi:hypothetical protein
MRTIQETFDFVITHLRKQGKRATQGGGKECAYRGDDGTSCAIGCLIPDNIYDPEIEGRGFCGLCISNKVQALADYLLAEHPGLFVYGTSGRTLGSALQLLHDEQLGEKKFEERVKEAAEDFTLEYKAP